MSRPPFAAALTLGLALALAGCAAAREPAPTPTGFASEEELFAAAEETYRAYVKAANEVDLSDPDTAEPVYEWLVDDALSATREEMTTGHAQGLTRTGEAVVDDVELVEADPADATASLDVCLNVADVEVLDESGESLIAADRGDVQAVRVEVVPAPTTSTRLAVAAMTGRSGGLECTSDG
ncbi:hypothetical protein ACWDR7_04440 [Microbacterium sp. NPDC003461]